MIALCFLLAAICTVLCACHSSVQSGQIRFRINDEAGNPVRLMTIRWGAEDDDRAFLGAGGAEDGERVYEYLPSRNPNENRGLLKNKKVVVYITGCGEDPTDSMMTLPYRLGSFILKYGL